MFPHDWIKILNINIIQVILCPFQGIIYSGTWCPCPFIVDVNFDLLAKLWSSYMITWSLIFLLQLRSNLSGDTFQPCIYHTSKLSPLIFHHWSFLSELVFTVIVTKCWFLNSTALFISISHLSAFLLNQELSFPQLFAHLLIISMHS